MKNYPEITYDELVKCFFLTCPEVVRDMRNCNHHYDEANGILNPYHLEGDVLTHTLMVVQQGEIRKVNFLVKLACLFHDFGKIECREEKEKKQRVSFYNHDAYSAYKMLQYIPKFEKYFNFKLSKADKILLFKMVTLHTDLYKCDDKSLKGYIAKYSKDIELVKHIRELAFCDGLGRYSDESVSHRYDSLKKMDEYIDTILSNESNIEVVEKKHHAIVMVGLPMSGKSTWMRNFTKENQDYEILSRDNVILELGKGLSYTEAYNTVDQNEVNKIFQDRCKEAIENRKNIIFDLTNMSKKARRKSIGNLSNDYKKTAQVIIADLEILKERNAKRVKEEGKHIPEEVIDAMVKSFYPPMYDEFDEIFYKIF